MFEALLAGTIAGFLWLDRYQLGQILISRPIVAGPLTGLILGDLSTGCLIGMMYELLWLRRPPVGGYIAPDSTLPSVSATAVASSLAGTGALDPLSVAFLAFLATYPLSVIASRFDGIFRVALGRLALLAESAILKEDDKSVVPYILTGLVLGFTCAFFIVSIYVFVTSSLVMWGVGLIPTRLGGLLAIGFYAVIMIGVSDLAVAFSKSIQVALFVTGMVIAISVCYLFSIL